MTDFKVCCVCNEDNLSQLHNLSKNDGKLRICEKLEFCVPEINSLKSSYANSICKNCLTNLKNVYKFKRLCIKTHKNLLNRSKNDESSIFEPHIQTEIKSEPVQLTPDDEEASKEEMVTVYRVEVIKEVSEEEPEENNYEDDIGEDLNQVAESLASYQDDSEGGDRFFGFSNTDIERSNVSSRRTIETITRLAPTDNDLHLQCKICGVKFRTALACIEHEREHEDKPHICLLCMKILGPHIQLRDHIQDHFKITRDKRTCNVCNETFSTSSKLHHHRATAHDIETHVCQVCNRHYATRIALNTHLRLHCKSEESRVACRSCGKKFSNRMNRDRHVQLIHEKLKPFACHLCEKSFGMKQYLKKHLDCHTGMKRYQCELCQKFFRYQKSLTDHLKIHNRYKCPLCDECFATFKLMKGHERLHRSDLPYHCNFCGMKFKLASHLGNHITRKHKDIVKPLLPSNIND